MPEKSKIANDFSEHGTQFLKIEVETGLTFASLALTAEPGSADRIREQANVRKAYETVLRLREKFEATPSAAGEIDDGMEKLRSVLENLGENLNAGS